MTTLSVVIVSYNTRELLRLCLTSVLQAGPTEVTVVDNASSDDSAQMVQADFPQVRLIASALNLGFVRANNLALRESCGDHLLLLNPDAELQEGALSTLQGLLDDHPQAGAVGPRLVYGDGALQHAAFRFPTLLQTYFDFFPWPARLLQSTLNGRYPRNAYSGRPFQVDFVLGACLMIRRTAIDQIGLLDERYFMYCEEMDWCKRLGQTGWGVWCEPRATVVHREAQSSRQTRWPSYVEKWRSRFIFYERYYPAWWQIINRQIVRAGLWAEVRRARAAHRRGDLTSS
ncbi:MAG: glycosyltransferase family 2 protein, partial [Chloroflexota bacterium]|nr:glycosyltransferase family 2 protein [Chloroflexota bacterium]